MSSGWKGCAGEAFDAQSKEILKSLDLIITNLEKQINDLKFVAKASADVDEELARSIGMDVSGNPLQIRSVFESNGYTVDWEPGATSGNSTITLTSPNGETQTLKEGEDYYIGADGKSYFYNNVRAILEANGSKVDFEKPADGGPSTITVTTPNADGGVDVTTLVEGVDYYIGKDNKAHFLDNETYGSPPPIPVPTPAPTPTPTPAPAPVPAPTPSSTQTIVLDVSVLSSQLKDLGWVNVTPEMVKDLIDCLEKYDITTPERIRHFISQCSHESGAGKWTKELASGSAYENRADIGNTQPGDGPKFKGGGYIQLTGRYNYQAFANAMGDPKIVELGVDYVAANYPWSSAGFWWSNNNMNALVDTGATVEQITKRVNGGYNGLADRQKYYDKCCEIFK